jgi:phage shock protein C
MQRIIQINIAGKVIPIEEDAYLVLKDYLNSLEKIFAGEEGNDEIIQDIEFRIAELFGIRLQNGIPAIDRNDVQKVIETLGPASELGDDDTTNNKQTKLPTVYVKPNNSRQERKHYDHGYRRIYRDPDDKWLGGVCSGLAHYFDIDPVIVRLIFAAMLFIGVGLVAYIIAWIVIPKAQTPDDYMRMSGGSPMDIHTMAHNMGEELQDLKRRGEQMSRDLKDFFSKKK